MSSEQSAAAGRQHPSNRGRLRRSGQALVRVGALLLAVSLVVTLVGGLTTRSMIDHLRTNSAELLDGSATVTLDQGATRALYVTGGLVAPGEDLPTPVEAIECTVAGPDGDVPVAHLADEGRQVGLDNPLARFQVVGSFRAADAGQHTITCSGLGVVVAPEVSPAGAALRIGSLMLGSLGVFGGATLLLIGGALALIVRYGTEEDDDDGLEVGAGDPPVEGAEEWWEEERRSPAAERDPLDGAPADDDVDGLDESDDGELAESDEDEYIDLTDEELASLSDEEIAELLASGALVYVDEDDEDAESGGEPFDQDVTRETNR
ncbi:hypothetical protein [Ornithinimicrobium sp. LYQ103]|uniref:hypothetical protein n=1 Tax=Ornithinimicrobium sp. LYQ103 TaxID=3378796 RepID=UPI0038550F35